MTGRPGWWPAVVLVLVTNALAMTLWYWNRSVAGGVVVELVEPQAWVSHGGPEAEVLQLNLGYQRTELETNGVGWADSSRLVRLGFAPWRFMPPEEGIPQPRRHPLRRPAWVLLAVDAPPVSAVEVRAGSRQLVPVAVGDDPEALYRESGDRARHLVLRGVVGLRTVAVPAGDSGRAWRADLDLLTPARLHVPQSLVPILRELSSGSDGATASRFTVRLRTGRLHLPWMVGVVPGGGG